MEKTVIKIIIDENCRRVEISGNPLELLTELASLYNSNPKVLELIKTSIQAYETFNSLGAISTKPRTEPKPEPTTEK